MGVCGRGRGDGEKNGASRLSGGGGWEGVVCACCSSK